ncbi:MAG: S8 family serine peptidase [Firmicutes bacterium]|nr:S8 family serine peptidase [Bacillota bacterium]
MRKKIIAILLVACIFILTVSAVTYGSNHYERKIIVFNDNIKPDVQNVLVAKYGYRLKYLHLINATVALLPSEAQEALAKTSGVIGVEDDAKVYTSSLPTIAKTKSTQILPWGINRINADLAWRVSIGSGVRVAVIDTGIDLTHPDLMANVKGGFNAINRKESINDDNGHGTHVAGVIAAVDNDIGVIGVAPEANLYAVKVLDKTGTGRISDAIEGIQWSVDNHMQVVNMSFGTTSYSRALDKAIKEA